MKYDRPLWSDERGLALINQYSGGFSIAGIFQLTGQVNPESLRKSLDFIQSSYPRLNCHIIGDAKNLQFKQDGTQPIPLEILKESDDLSWRDILFKEVNTPLPRDQYLLKCFLVSAQHDTDTHYLITIIDHCISDGLSFMRMNDLILKYYDQVEQGLALEQSEISFPEDKIDIFWENSNYKAIFSSFMAWIRQQIKVRSMGLKKMIPDQKLSVQQRQGNFVHRCLDLELTQKLLKRCREEKTQANGMLCAAMLWSAYQDISQKPNETLSLSCQSYVDLRSKANPRIKDEHMALMVSSVFSFHKLNNTTQFWDLTKEVNEQIKTQIDQGDFLKYPPLLGNLIEMSFLAPEDSTQTVSVTNIGKVRVKKSYGELQVETACIFPNITIYSNLIVLTTYKFRDQIQLTFSFSYPSMSLERVEKFADRVVGILQDAVT